MMDRTALFTACLRAVRTRNKELASGVEQRVLPRRTTSAFQRRAAAIVASVARLAAFLAEHRAGYLSTGRGVGSPALSDAEKDQVDTGAQEIMRTCSQLVRQFRLELVPDEAAAVGDHAGQHRRAVADSMEAYLKEVCGVYAEMKAVRVKRSVDKRNMGQIVSGLSRRVPPVSVGEGPRIDRSPDVDLPRAETADESERKPRAAAATSSYDDLLLASGAGDDDLALSAADQQQLEMENQLMFDELHSMTEEVRQVETKVVKIAELQQIFTEKVLEQEKDVDRIGDLVVGTTENIKDANEQLRSAIKKNAGTRVWVLFFLVVISFSLLFLDWYNV